MGNGKFYVVVLCSFLSFSILPAEPIDAAKTTKTILNTVVKVRSEVPAKARTARSLGTEREGNGVVIGSNRLILTIGDLVLKANRVEVTGPSGKGLSARFLGYDHNTGFGLIGAEKPLNVEPIKFGNSSEVHERDWVLVVSHGGPDSVQGAFVVSRREFTGYWEYLLENAIFTAPPHAGFGGAALIGSDGRLLGVGSLIVPDAAVAPEPIPGNMFVPINLLKPIFADLIIKGRSSKPPRPWLGIYSQEIEGRILVVRITPGGPGDKAGAKPGDMIVGVGGTEVKGLADFYRKVWSRGKAGVKVPLNMLQGMHVHEFMVRSSDRYKHLKLRPNKRNFYGQGFTMRNRMLGCNRLAK
ncbi:MAG: S1C family serine protease [Candidatus Binatia bacterium]|nr:S1C family serine protease [Candidatus Binatia bacterium]